MNLNKEFNNTTQWSIAYWSLLCLWVLGAILFMYKIKAGLLNSYLSDVAFPPWFYIQIRGLHRKDKRLLSIPVFGNWFGRSPWRAGISIFIVGLLSELWVLVWPTHLTTGTFDKYDILAYAIGLIICMAADLRQKK
jgi:hypothetical protein